jgi:hypothetical protein
MDRLKLTASCMLDGLNRDLLAPALRWIIAILAKQLMRLRDSLTSAILYLTPCL